MANTADQGSASRFALVQTVSPQLRLAAQVEDPFPEIDGSSPEIGALKHEMRRVACDPFVTVLIQGESGTGKERVAAAVHRASPRHRAPFVVVNCGGLPPTLVEDELFGHIRGAFTGAVSDRPGPFERAEGGTVFLDEVGELTMEAQVKLLRALQQRTVQRLGGRRETAFDVRLIAATHVPLSRAVARRQFREDLFYRLKVYELHVPALRRRGSADVEVLASAILQRLAERRHRTPAALDPLVLDAFGHHVWPGNVRELENTLERMLVAADGGPLLALEHLPPDFGIRSGNSGYEIGQLRTTRPSPTEIEQALERHHRKVGRAAIDLGLSRHQLYRALKRCDV